MIKVKRSEMLAAREPIRYAAPLHSVGLEGLDAESNTIAIELAINQAGSSFRIHGKAFLEAGESCDRCLTEYTTVLEADFDLLLTENSSLISSQEETDVYLFSGAEPEFDFAPVVRDALLLERSMKRLCKEDCKGLCPHCGTNLNRSDCNCETSNLDERWAPLKKLRMSLLENEYGTAEKKTIQS